MEVKPYPGRKATAPAQLLKEKGVILKNPVQVHREDLQYDDGIDIIYKFRGMNPAKFKEFADILLLAAKTEAERYGEYRWKFAKFEVQLNRTAKGRKTIRPRWDFVAGKNPDPDVMVYGEEALGAPVPEGFKKPFLVNKIQTILNLAESQSAGPYVDKQRPFTVLSMTICIRAGEEKARRDTKAAFAAALKAEARTKAEREAGK